MLNKRRADKPNNSLQTVSKIQTRNKRNANKRRSIKLQQILKKEKQVKENTTEWYFRRFRHGERKNRETRFSGGN